MQEYVAKMVKLILAISILTDHYKVEKSHWVPGLIRYRPTLEGPRGLNFDPHDIIQSHPKLCFPAIELGLHCDRQTVRQRDCLITEIPPLHQRNQTVRSNQSTAPTLAVVLVMMSFCALKSGGRFLAQRRVGKIKFWSWDHISVGCRPNFCAIAIPPGRDGE
jgi:hypothetical protein